MKIVIVGATGRMGKMLLAKMTKQGYNCDGLDLPLENSKIQLACRDAHFIILCIPITAFRQVLTKIVPFFPEKAVLVDIASVKEQAMNIMQQSWSGSVIGTHPLFGPNSAVEDGQNIAITPGIQAKEQEIQALWQIFTSCGWQCFLTTAKIHDHAQAKIQNLNFINNLVYFALLAGQEDLYPFITPSFLRRKKAAEKMLTEDAQMFATLFEANPYSQDAIRQYRKLLNAAAAGEIDLLLNSATWWWQESEKK